MKVFVLGSEGMLGRYVSTYFTLKGYDVVNVNRPTINAYDVNEPALRAILYHKGLRENDVVINCIGLIKQKKDITDLAFIMVNGVFPRILANVCEIEKARLIHITTDCVFSGLRGLYNEDDLHDPVDMYGKSKSLGEPLNCTVIRTSIIGEELKGKLSLIEWVKSMKDKTANGFYNHNWNGLTCLQAAKVFEDIIVNDWFWKGVRHIHSPNILNKSELVHAISWSYGLNLTINPTAAPNKCDRSLATIYKDYDFKIPTIEYQIEEQRDFYPTLSKNIE